jgi:CTP synthase
MLEENGLANVVCRELDIHCAPCDLTDWKAMLQRIQLATQPVKIALVGKYTKLHDAYLSVNEALSHAGYENGARVWVEWVDSEQLCPELLEERLSGCDGILVPGGFGDRGIEGMVLAARYARTHNVPYLGICLGMQIAVMEYARGVLGFEDANSSEFAPDSSHRVIDLMPDQHGNLPKGGTMRLGAYPCNIIEGTMMEKAYRSVQISERHRHRYEFNNEFREALTAAGLKIAGTSPDGRLVEAVEIPENDFFVGVQYHPEFKSRPNRAHPLFREFIAASLAKSLQK